MRMIVIAALAALAASTAQASGDGEKLFAKCKSCHTIASASETFVKGGKTGPNLYGVVGRKAGSVEGFRYGDDMVAAGEAGLVWDAEQIAAFLEDPTAYLRARLDDPKAKSKMSRKTKDEEDREELAEYLASFSE